MSAVMTTPPARARSMWPAALLIAALFAAVGFAAFVLNDPARGYVEYPMAVRTDIPAAIAIGKRDEVWFTMDFSDSVGMLQHGKISRFRIGERNVEPIGLGVDSQGNAWIADQVTRAISRVTQAGEIKSFPIGTPIARMARLTVAPDDSVWFAESTAYSVTRLKDGEFARNVIQSARGGPYGVAVDKQGNVWATLQHANQILRIDPQGEMQWHWVPTPASAPSDIAADASGAVWILEYRSNKIGRLKGEEFTEFDIPGPSAGLAGLAVAADGSVWFGMLRQHALGRLRNGIVKNFPLPRDDARPCGVAIDSKGNIWYVDIAGYVGMLSAQRAHGD
jgi:virginiamycin B lyase